MKRIIPALIVLAIVGLGAGTMWWLWKKSQKPPVVAKTEAPRSRTSSRRPWPPARSCRARRSS
jgi:hypothetical protein